MTIIEGSEANVEDLAVQEIGCLAVMAPASAQVAEAGIVAPAGISGPATSRERQLVHVLIQQHYLLSRSDRSSRPWPTGWTTPATHHAASGEIDLMKYYTGSRPLDFYSRAIAAQEDVERLINFAGIILLA